MILPGTRGLLVVFSGLTFLAFLTLFVMAAHTDSYFAWTIAPPTTAAFLGAAYAAGCVIVVLGLRSGSWASIRVPYVAILVFTLVTLVATLLHLDRFHFGAPGVIARLAAWFWMAVYVLVPVAMLTMLLLQERRPKADQHRRQPLPVPVRLLLAAQGVVLLAVGVTLFVSPVWARLLWPWTLTPLTARAVAAWLVAFGVAAALTLRNGDLAGADISAWAYAVLATLELVVVLRYPETVRWSSPAAWAYLATAVSILGLAVYPIARARRGAPRSGFGSHL